MRLVTAAAFGAAVFFGAGGALADSISPETYEKTLEIGESVTIKKTVVVSEGRPTSAKVDVFFLADTTGSMSGQIGAAKSSAGGILSSLSGLGDVQFGVGEYKDTFDAFTYRTNTALTATTASVTSGINAWSASGGGDTPEGNLIGLERVAKETDWRDGSRRFVVMFGDAPGHVGEVDRFPDASGVKLDASEVDAIAALNDKGITVLIGNTCGTSLCAMNDAVDGQPAGQANRIAVATGGSVFTLSSSGAGFADLILAAIGEEFSTYTSVALSAVGNLPGVKVETSGPIIGSFSRDTEETFEFDVTFTALTAGVHSFRIDALVDGGSVASEKDKITVPGGPIGAVPLPAGLPLLLSALIGGGLIARRRRS